jgi:hypothetical protein
MKMYGGVDVQLHVLLTSALVRPYTFYYFEKK